MKTRNRRRFSVGAALLLAFGLPFLAARTDGQASPQAAQVRKAPAQAPVRTEELVPGPQTLKERTAIIVFVVWLWGTIAVLLVVLRWKIREVDRVHDLEHASRLDPPPPEPARR